MHPVLQGDGMIALALVLVGYVISEAIDNLAEAIREHTEEIK